MANPTKHHIAIFPFPARGHDTPLLSLTIKLAASASDVTFSFFSTSESNASLSSIITALHVPLPNLKIHDVCDGVPEDYVRGGDPKPQLMFFLTALPGNLRQALAEASKEHGQVTCFLTDLFVWPAGQIAEEMGVPWVAFWAAPPWTLVAYFYAELIRQAIGSGNKASTRLDETLDCIPCLSAYRVRDLPEGIVFADILEEEGAAVFPEDSPFARHVRDMCLQLPRAAAVIHNAADFMDSSVVSHLKTKLRNCLFVGPLPLLSPLPPPHDPHMCLAWLDRFKPATVAYVSFGTAMSPRAAEVAALAEGLEASGGHFLWSLDEKAKESLPDGFLERTKQLGLVVPWVPQSRVLGHVAVGAFITHCGWNSILESIAGGVPLICRPLWFDNKMNSWMVRHAWHIGVEVDGGRLTKDAVVGSIELVLKRDEGKEMRRRIRELKERAMVAVQNGGSSFRNFQRLLAITKRELPDTLL